MGFKDKLMHAWNAFTETGANSQFDQIGPGTYGSLRPDRLRINGISDRSIIGSIYNQIGIDVAAVEMLHCKLDDDGRFLNVINSGLNDCLTVEANLDQAGRAFRQDMAMSMFEKGTIAIVPVDTSDDPNQTGSYDILSLRVGEITSWYPQHVRVNLYNEEKGRKEEILLAKNTVAIVENPLYSVMNEPNSTLQRLIRKLALLDSIDEQTSSGKLDLIIQLPYVIKSEQRRQQAEQRRQDIEVQLKGSKYGIAYTDGTERITQLNRPAENNLLAQVEYLTNMLYSQLGLTKEVFDGTATEAVMLNYYNRTVEPILSAIAEGMKRAFLTKTARTQGQSIEFYRDPFKLVPASDIGDIADKLIRNQVFTGNEVRSILGRKPHPDPGADKLQNPNMPIQDQNPSAAPLPVAPAPPDTSEQDGIVNDTLNQLEARANELIGSSRSG